MITYFTISELAAGARHSSRTTSSYDSWQEVLHSCHDSLEGGHQGIVWTYQRGRRDYYWHELNTDVERRVKSFPDCSSSKSRPYLRGYSPGNVLAERTFQIVSMDFVIPLPKSRQRKTALLLFQRAFTEYVIAKPMAESARRIQMPSELPTHLRKTCTEDSEHLPA